ncbi:response regulator transcription factor [Kineosporia sp. J2-2]|uniref:Response regulator transcription factor n=1 Tax=Kineosporia corallincola TaxID=2835133 RepID=A0ABS5TRM0_9ACTN|nr:response regulator transcription factor [Kineosporia corallincola]
MNRVLIVQHAEEAGETTARFLRLHGFQVTLVRTGTEAIRRHRQADLVLLAADLPDLDPLAVCRAIRASGRTPVVMTMDQGTEMDRVLALQAGAATSVSEPYGHWELAARIEAVLRRVGPSSEATDGVTVHRTLRIDPRTRRAEVDGRVVGLTRKEFDVLHLLASRPEEVVSREELMTRVWRGEGATSSRTIDTHVSSLRTKLGARSWIRTVRGVGFGIGGPGPER